MSTFVRYIGTETRVYSFASVSPDDVIEVDDLIAEALIEHEEDFVVLGEDPDA